MKVISLAEAEKSRDIDIKLVTVRASRYRVFGSAERIPHSELVVIDLRDGEKPADFDQHYSVLEQHPMAAIVLVRKIG
jgi:hypothetical protein